MLELLVGAACYLTFFAVLPGVGTAMQVAALGLLFGAGAWGVIMGRVRPEPTSVTEIVLYAVGIAFLLVALPNGDETIVMPMAFLCTIIFISFVARSISLERLLDIGAIVALLCVVTAIAVDHQKALAALIPKSSVGALDRFMPLGSTPNLVGYIYGAGAILMARRVLLSKSASVRFAMAVGVLFCLLFVLAASARSSILGLAAAGFVGVALEYRLRRFFASTWVKWTTVAVVVLGFAFSDKIVAYFTRMLELDSETRGVSTGGSGRTELWARGVSVLFSEPGVFLFGGGFRSSSTDVIGFSTESSYITILLDSGVFVGMAVIAVFVFSPFKALSLTPPQNRHDSSLVLLAAFLTFLIVESIFNRYLLAIGNPTSLLSLLVLVSLSMRAPAPVAELTAAEQEASDPQAAGIQGVAIR